MTLCCGQRQTKVQMTAQRTDTNVHEGPHVRHFWSHFFVKSSNEVSLREFCL